MSGICLANLMIPFQRLACLAIALIVITCDVLMPREVVYPHLCRVYSNCNPRVPIAVQQKGFH